MIELRGALLLGGLFVGAMVGFGVTRIAWAPHESMAVVRELRDVSTFPPTDGVVWDSYNIGFSKEAERTISDYAISAPECSRVSEIKVIDLRENPHDPVISALCVASEYPLTIWFRPSGRIKRELLEGRGGKVVDVLTFLNGRVVRDVADLYGDSETLSRLGARDFDEDSIGWDSNTAPHRAAIAWSVRTYLGEDINTCHGISDIALSPTLSKPGDPIFFAACDADDGPYTRANLPYNIWFRPGGFPSRDREKVW